MARYQKVIDLWADNNEEKILKGELVLQSGQYVTHGGDKPYAIFVAATRHTILLAYGHSGTALKANYRKRLPVAAKWRKDGILSTQLREIEIQRQDDLITYIKQHSALNFTFFFKDLSTINRQLMLDYMRRVYRKSSGIEFKYSLELNTVDLYRKTCSDFVFIARFSTVETLLECLDKHFLKDS